MPALALAAYAIGIGLTGTATIWGMTASMIYFMAAMEALTLTISYFTYQHNKSRMKEMLDGMGKFSGK